MASRGRRSRVQEDAAGLGSADEVLRRSLAKLRGDRRAVRRMLADTRSRVGAAGRKRLDAEIERASVGRSLADDELRRAGATIPVVRGARVPKPRPLPSSLRRVVRVRTPDGRLVPMGVDPQLVSLGRVEHVNARRAFRAIADNSRAIDSLARTQHRLASTQRELVWLVSQLQSRGDVALHRGLVDATRREARRSARREGQLRSMIQREAKSIRAELKKAMAQHKKELQIQKLQTASTTLHTSAYSHPNEPGHPSNLTIAGNHLAWSFLGDLAERANVKFLSEGPGAWLLPLGSFLTGVYALGDEQHIRFLTGVASDFTVVSATTATSSVSLIESVAEEHRTELPNRANVFAAATPIAVPPFSIVLAEVQAGVLTVTVRVEDPGGGTPDFTGTRVAWIVDADPP